MTQLKIKVGNKVIVSFVLKTKTYDFKWNDLLLDYDKYWQELQRLRFDVIETDKKLEDKLGELKSSMETIAKNIGGKLIHIKEGVKKNVSD